MNYYKDAFQRYADFEGRSRRSAFWYFILFNGLAAIAANLIDELVGDYPIFGLVYFLAALIPFIAVAVRRLHDTGKSGWWMLLYLTGIGIIVLIVFWCIDSTPGENQFGPNPKEIGNDDIAAHLVD